jgi:hypothetical protein
MCTLPTITACLIGHVKFVLLQTVFLHGPNVYSDEVSASLTLPFLPKPLENEVHIANNTFYLMPVYYTVI